MNPPTEPANAERPWPPPGLPSAYLTVNGKAKAKEPPAAASVVAPPAAKVSVKRADGKPRAPRGRRLTPSPAAVRQRQARVARGQLGGRPPRWTEEGTAERLLCALADPAHATKAAAARAAGIGYATLARWQAEQSGLQLAWQWGQHSRYQLRQARNAARRAARPRRPAPTKQHRLVCWFLTYRVHPEHPLCFEHEHRACARVNLPWERWVEACGRFPALMRKVHADRARRLSYLVQAGSIGINTKVVHPANPHRNNYPAECLYRWTRGGIVDGCYAHERARSPRTGQRWL